MRIIHPGVCPLALWVCFSASQPLFAATSSGITGQWQESDFTGMGQADKACAWISYATRKLVIDTAPDGSLVGVYSNYEQAVWSLHAKPDCAFPTPTMSPALFQRVRLWPVRLVSIDGGRWKMIASPAKCTGDACSAPNLSKAEFETTLTLDGAQLLDQGDGVSGSNKELRYRRSEEARSLSDSALAALGGLMKPLDSGECNGFYAQSLHRESALQGHQNDFCNLRRQMASIQTQPISGSNIANSIALDRVLQADGSAQNTADVLLVGAAEFQDGTTLPRIVILRRQQTAWKVFALFAQ